MSLETTTVRVAAAQTNPRFADVSANLATLVDRLREAAEAGARLIVFPECALTGYCFESKAEALRVAEPIPGPSVDAVAEHCRALDVFCVFGLLEKSGEKLFNACALVGPNGPIGSYRKIHLPFLGVDRFADPGDRPFAVHDAAGVKIGMHICYDGAFPESGRVLTLLGAELLVLPTNWPRHSECAAEHLMICRSMENVVYSMAVDRVGEERGFRFIGRSSIVDSAGAVLASAGADREEILYAEIEPALARQKRLVRVPGLHEIDRIADRRPGFYRPLVETADRS